MEAQPGLGEVRRISTSLSDDHIVISQGML